jgi:hypothetical protein
MPPGFEAQPAGKVARIGILSLGAAPSPEEVARFPFGAALRDLGWIAGRNIFFEPRYLCRFLDRSEGHVVSYDTPDARPILLRAFVLRWDLTEEMLTRWQRLGRDVTAVSSAELLVCPILVCPPQRFRPLPERLFAPSALSFHPLTSTKSPKSLTTSVRAPAALGFPQRGEGCRRSSASEPRQGASLSRRRLTSAAGGAIVARGGGRRHGLAPAKGLLKFLGSSTGASRPTDVPAAVSCSSTRPFPRWTVRANSAS